jgi:single-stranded-DNA-specific exonuclease
MAEIRSLLGKQWVLPQATIAPAELVAWLQNQRGLDAPLQRTVPLEHRETVAIFGDYDCDGVTASAQFVRFFRRRGLEPVVRLPHRVLDGYGLSMDIVEELALKDVSLLITVDTGSTAIAEIALAQERGIDVIVTDHHHLGEELPLAYALVHPALKRNAPLPCPSGAGVVRLLLNALEGGDWPDSAIDDALAMIGTVADLVELRGINRQLVQRGLKQWNTLSSGPLALLRQRTKAHTSIDIAFRVAPRINAAGRMDDPRIALVALLEGGAPLDCLDSLNTERQQQTERFVRDGLAVARQSPDPLLWYANAEYPHGIIGLIAGRLTEATGKPSCIVTIDGDTCTASLRSTQHYHIAEGLQRCGDLLLSFGGHAQAGGCRFSRSSMEAFHIRLQEDVLRHADVSQLLPTLTVDAFLTPQAMTQELCNQLSTLEPFGQGNPEPRFLLQSVALDDSRIVGREQTHLQCRIGGRKAIGFGLGHIDPSGLFDAVCRVGMDTWQGMTQPQLFLDDVRISQPVRQAVHVKTLHRH